MSSCSGPNGEWNRKLGSEWSEWSEWFERVDAAAPVVTRHDDLTDPRGER